MTTLLRPLLRPQTLGLGLGISLFAGHQIRTYRTPIHLDGPVDSYTRKARTPIVKNGGLNPGAVRQISSGSIIGMLILYRLGVGLAWFEGRFGNLGRERERERERFEGE